ncbi:MAG: hypothetical protein A3C44_03105 [Gammaproteobacteria bacterium RIFCSPHIGHO2_02_FULL_39_13]|nr:MAG: hypothetical protein A3C44_03105 [Gammaproteobacteria bacterium RIFCSPHIGHO2_02_FULL_39_13]OGT50330.1 MAG: hypothetical protein A3E53_01095 [Gammaproteobacteria bacterium RIFCSPHIGHO2_12_FULL_39_24]
MSSYWRIIISSSIAIASSCAFSPVFADNLIQIYQRAIISDPIFAQAESTWQSQKMNLPIAEAGYLPQVSIAANTTREYANNDAVSAVTGAGTGDYWWQYGYTLTATQPVFNFVVWAQVRGASATVKSATATYLAAQQSLMQRTATAYFNVLQAYDQMRFTIADKEAVWQQYLTAREQFRVGLIAITDEYDARSSYDQAVAQQIAAQNNLNIQLENLRAITNRYYPALNGLGIRLPLVTPKPANVDKWVEVANKQNYQIKAQNYNVLVAMEAIKQAAAGDYPVLGVQGQFGETHAVDNPPDTAQDAGSVGLNLTYAPIQGGLVIASTQQARYNYVTASGLLEQTHRTVVDQARSSFLSVLSNVSKIKADKQSIISAQNALEATQAGYKVGTRTMVDVLKALTTVYQAQLQHANDQYAYINNLVALKAAAGTLSVADLETINRWLGAPIQFPEQTSVAKIPVGVEENATNKPDIKNLTDKVTEKKIVMQPEKIKELPSPKMTMLPQPART